jgi:phosphatidylinositol glycan class P protein
LDGDDDHDHADDDDDDDDDDADFQSHYSLDGPISSGSSESDSVHGDEPVDARPLLHRSNSTFLSANSFAPPFYNRPPTPLPPSPSLTSLLRPSFSTNTSRPTTPDSSENDTPNDTEAAVAKSARTATTVPRASPKVPTYEYYGFVLYLLSSLAFRM